MYILLRDKKDVVVKVSKVGADTDTTIDRPPGNSVDSPVEGETDEKSTDEVRS